VLVPPPSPSLPPSLLRSLFDAEVPEPVTVLHILELANRGHRLPAVPQDGKVRGAGFRGGGTQLTHAPPASPSFPSVL
jgi:hypothetical protein